MAKSSKKPRAKGSKGIPVLILVLILILASAIQVYRPYPTVESKQNAPSIKVPGEFVVSFPEQGQSAVGTDNFGVIASSPNQTSTPIASVAKIMTAYLVLETYPLKIGEDGPTITMDAQDFREYQEALADGHSVLQIAEGEILTQKQMLQGLMLPSGNNIANKLGRWVAGSDDAFVQKMNETAQALGMTSTHYADASGVSPETVSNAVDQIKLAQAAMQDPVFREIVAMPQATLPVAGTVYNVNNMLGKSGVVGIKTGSTTRAGGNFVSAAPIYSSNETHYLIAVVLSQHSQRSLQTALDENVKMLNQVRPYFQMYPVIEANASLGQISSAWDSVSELKATQALRVFGYPGMEIPYAIKLTNLQLPISANQSVAALEIQTGKELQTIPLYSAQEIKKPQLLWRLLRY